MRIIVIALSVGLCISCGAPDVPGASAPQPASQPVTTQSAAPSTQRADSIFPLRVDGTRFIDSSGKPFAWRGVSAFRLAEMIATGQEPEVVRYFDWMVSRKLTVARVLLMARHLFQLTPDAGRAALPRLLDLAKARGLAVEAVALADTEGLTLDYDSHVQQVGRIALEKGNAFVEIANEPGHATQDRRLHDPAVVKRLAELLPAGVLGALGSAEYDDAYAAGNYATFHFPRRPEWGHVLSLNDGISMLSKWKKPVINDEPIGAAAKYQPGRRDNSVARFGAAGAVAEFIGLGSTFHYEGGLQARLPDGREEACLDAWRRGIDLAANVPVGELLVGEGLSRRLATASGGRQTLGRLGSDRAALLIVDPAEQTSVQWTEGWIEDGRANAPGVLVVTATRRR